MYRSLYRVVCGVAAVAAVTACETSPTEPAIPEVSTPGVFELQLSRRSSPPLSGSAWFTSAADALVRQRVIMRTSGAGYEEVAIIPNVFGPNASGPIPTGRHRFSGFGGDRGWAIIHQRLQESPLTDGFGFANGGVLEITESTETALRGRIDVTISTFEGGQQVTYRLRGSFWATPDENPFAHW